MFYDLKDKNLERNFWDFINKLDDFVKRLQKRNVLKFKI